MNRDNNVAPVNQERISFLEEDLLEGSNPAVKA